MPGNRFVGTADKYADIAQLVEQLIRNQQAKSSNLFVGSSEKQGVIVQTVTPLLVYCRFGEKQLQAACKAV